MRSGTEKESKKPQTDIFSTKEEIDVVVSEVSKMNAGDDDGDDDYDARQTVVAYTLSASVAHRMRWKNIRMEAVTQFQCRQTTQILF